jgi:hypothetical protein
MMTVYRGLANGDLGLLECLYIQIKREGIGHQQGQDYRGDRGTKESGPNPP